MTLFSCVLKGKTTSEDQFARFLKSYNRALQCCSPETIHVKTYFFLNSDTAEKAVKGVMKGEDYIILRRDDDPGELRNEFLARMQTVVLKEKSYFTFFDGDDEIVYDYFCQDYRSIDGHGFAIGNPYAVYGTSESDFYPLKWCLVAANDDIHHATMMDYKGCQSWGNIYEMDVAKIARFGRGLFEDVTFMYSVVDKYRNPVLFWGMVYLWHRDNANAMTRTSSSVAQILDGMDNLDTAESIALRSYKSVLYPEVYRRYTIGCLTLIRNAVKTKEKDRALNTIFNRMDREAFNLREIEESDPKLMAKIREEFKGFDELMRKEGFIDVSASEDCTVRPREAGS